MTTYSLVLFSVLAGLPDDFAGIGIIPRAHGGTEVACPTAIVLLMRFTLSLVSILNITVTPFGNHSVPATTTADSLHVVSAYLRSDAFIAPHSHCMLYPKVVQHLFFELSWALALIILGQLACDLEQQWRQTGRVSLTHAIISPKTSFGSGSGKVQTYVGKDVVKTLRSNERLMRYK